MTPVCEPSSPPKTSRKDAFALVATMSLMVLLILLALGMLGLASISLREAARSEAHHQAQANARMALTLALGELQRELGPDRRINCAAGIDPEALPDQRQWLAVYDSWRADEPQRPDPEALFRGYLVSGNRAVLNNRGAARIALPGETVELFERVNPTAAAPDDRVTVGVVPVGDAGGRYAWWISDEGSKAKINAGQDQPSTMSPELRTLLAMNAAQGVGFRMVPDFENTEIAGQQPWEFGDNLRAKSASLPSAGLIDGVAMAAPRRIHDLTTVGHGLLTDVRNSGFRRDLSLYLERPHSPNLRQPLYRVNGSADVNFTPDSDTPGTLDRFSGITMEELWVHYNLYKEVRYDRPTTNDDTVGRRPAGFPTLLSANTREELVIDHFYPYKRRVYSQVKYVISLAATPTAGQADRFDLRIAVDPVVVLWNPYNVALEYQTGAFTSVNFTGLPLDAEFETPDGTVTVPFSGAGGFFRYENVNIIQGLVGLDHPIVLQPGESRVFSRVEGRADSLSSGWRYTEGTLLNHANFPKALERTATVRLTLRPATSGGYLNYVTYWLGRRNPGNASNPALQSGTLVLRGDTALGDLPTVTTPQTITIDNIVAERKIPHMLISYDMRAESDNRTPSKPWIWSNPSISFRIAPDNSLAVRLIHQMEVTAIPVSTWENPHVQITPGNQAYWGGGRRADTGVPFFTLRSVPLTPLQSIAAFQHACANGFRRPWKDSTVCLPREAYSNIRPEAEGLDGHRYLAPMGSRLIGNSFAHPLIRRDRAHDQVLAADDQTADPVAAPLPVADHAYLANNALWDSWFFSSLTPQTAPPFRANPRTLQQVFDDFIPDDATQTSTPLPTNRFVPYRSSRDPELRALVSENTPTDEAYRRLAAHLLIDGAFNVNSTSVSAWKVMLGSLRDHESLRLDRSSGDLQIQPATDGTAPVSTLLVANGPVANPSGNPTEPNQWIGSRRLSDSQIDTLARELVREIQRRGPFLSLADFVNRRLGNNTDLARHGALQAAIQAAGLNGALDQKSRALGSITGAPFPETGLGSRSTGVPGYISQADLLTPLGPVLQARSDTFTIRALGRATAPDGGILAEVWCEAVVQRVPDYIDPAEEPHLRQEELNSPVNQAFGRQLRVISFRWLNSGES